MENNFDIGSKFSSLREFGTGLIQFQSKTGHFYGRASSKLLKSVTLQKPYNEDAIYYEVKYKCLRSGVSSSTNLAYR